MNDYNSMGIEHICTYLSHVSGETHRKIVEENIRLKEALEYQALVNHGYSHLAQRALNGFPLDKDQKEFLEWIKPQLNLNNKL